MTFRYDRRIQRIGDMMKDIKEAIGGEWGSVDAQWANAAELVMCAYQQDADPDLAMRRADMLRREWPELFEAISHLIDVTFRDPVYPDARPVI
jgi:hypothetical protein